MESHFPIPDRKKLREKSYRGKCGPMLLISNVERGPVKFKHHCRALVLCPLVPIHDIFRETGDDVEG